MPSKPQEKARAAAFRRNERLEELLQSLNGVLGCADGALLRKPRMLGPAHPVVFIMGPLRSGTTLFMQWLAASGLVAYPTNLLARFYGAPLVGAQIQRLLTDPRFNFRDEILDFAGGISFESENGKTRGALAPNEFWYFWRRFLPFGDLDWLPDGQLARRVDRRRLVAELTGLTRIFGKPFALKAMILNYNIPFLDRLFDEAVFVQIRREPVANVASVLDARRRQLGSERHWYSFKIPEYPRLRRLDPVAQAAGQVHYINQAVARGLADVAESRKLIVSYEEFCRQPRRLHEELVARLGMERRAAPYRGPGRFRLTRAADVPRRRAIEKALAGFRSGD